MKMRLDLFAGGHSVTCYKDSHMTTFSASSTSDVQAEATVTLTVTPADGYELDEIEVIEGGVTVTYANSAYTFEMGSSNVVLYAKTKANNKYMITEETMACLNDSVTVLHQNTVVSLTKNGVPKEISAAGGGTSVTTNAAINQLIEQGVLVKL